MKRSRSVFALLVIVALIVVQLGFATPDPDDDGTDDSMKGFSWMKEKKVILGNQVLNTSLPPVIKEGRTLIPVRAVGEALKAKVYWNVALGLVTITNKEGTIVINLYLKPEDQGKVTVTENGVTSIVSPDAKSGRINNSTYVPLRFIAETLGIKVDDSKSGINLNPGAVIVPKKMKFYSASEIPEFVTIALGLNGYTFTGIKDLAPANYIYDGASSVKIPKGYIQGLKAEETKLYFQFQKDGKLELKDFEIELEYGTSSSLEDKPKLEPDEVENPKGDVKVAMQLNGYTFSGILYKGKPLVATEDFIILNNQITIKGAYIAKLSGEEVDLFFFFTKGNKVANRKFEIEFEDD